MTQSHVNINLLDSVRRIRHDKTWAGYYVKLNGGLSSRSVKPRRSTNKRDPSGTIVAPDGSQAMMDQGMLWVPTTS
jgi:hypothetical protein